MVCLSGLITHLDLYFFQILLLITDRCVASYIIAMHSAPCVWLLLSFDTVSKSVFHKNPELQSVSLVLVGGACHYNMLHEHDA